MLGYRGWLAATAACVSAMPALAQDDDAAQSRISCESLMGAERSGCLSERKRAQAAAAAGGTNAKDAKLFNTTVEAARARAAAGDYTGATAIYRAAIDANPKSPVLHRLYAGMAISYRQQGVAAFNAGGKPVYPGPGASNDAIRLANASNAGLELQKRAASVPLITQGLEAAVKAATLADAQKDRGGDETIGVELREAAALLHSIDRPGVLATSRASGELEAKWLRKWLAATPAAGADQVGRYGIATAAGLVARDPAAALALADEVKMRSGGDADAAIGYAEIVVAAKAPAGDPHRAQALAGLAAVQANVTEAGRQRRLQQARAALSAS